VENTTPDSSLLVEQLASLGVRTLRVREMTASYQAPDPTQLIRDLATHPEPRLREALIPLFLRHPEYASLVAPIVAALEPTDAERLRRLYTATVFLQRFWRTALGIYLGETPLLPDYFGALWGLPAADEYFGEAGLRALAALQKQETGYEWFSAYQTIMDLFLKQLKLDYGLANR
jgi:hypothetical protein